MAVTYVKKKNMYLYAKDVLNIRVPMLKECFYKFYRGWECLEFHDCDYMCYKITFAGKLKHIKVFYYDDDCNEQIVRDEWL